MQGQYSVIEYHLICKEKDVDPDHYLSKVCLDEMNRYRLQWNYYSNHQRKIHHPVLKNYFNQDTLLQMDAEIFNRIEERIVLCFMMAIDVAELMETDIELQTLNHLMMRKDQMLIKNAKTIFKKHGYAQAFKNLVNKDRPTIEKVAEYLGHDYKFKMLVRV